MLIDSMFLLFLNKKCIMNLNIEKDAKIRYK